MPVAKSYKDWERLSEPYLLNNKLYVSVRNPKTNASKQVRYYNDKEYAKMYGTAIEVKAEEPKKFKNLKHTLGFNKGYITIYTNSAENDEWFYNAPTRYHRVWGWYLISTEKDLTNLPAGVEAKKLYWKDIAVDEEQLKPEAEIKKVLNGLLRPLDAPTAGKYVGIVGERKDLSLVIKHVYSYTSSYGPKAIYIMEDENHNTYKWNTTPRKMAVGQIYNCRGTIKSHSVEDGKNITVLTRCTQTKGGSK